MEETNGAADSYLKDNKINEPDAEFYKKSDAYVLDADADKKNIVIEGKDTDATFHGVATLQMMFSSFSGKKFLDAHMKIMRQLRREGILKVSMAHGTLMNVKI